MLLDAMAADGVRAHEALMVGFDYVDREAAYAAQTNYVAQEHLLGRFDAELMGERLALAGDEEAPLETKAPGNFAAQKRRAESGTPTKKGARVL